MTDIRYCIWDFNGTILDDVETGIMSVNKMLADRGLPTLKSKEDYYKVFGFPIIDYYRALGFDFEREPYEVLAPIWVELYLENVKKARMYDDVISTLERFRKEGIVQTVISATEINMLKKQLSELGIIDYFDQVFGLDNIHAGSKLALAKEWRETHTGKAVLLGDTDHDAETARILDADCYLIARGHQSKAYLSRNTNALICESLTEAVEKIIE